MQVAQHKYIIKTHVHEQTNIHKCAQTNTHTHSSTQSDLEDTITMSAGRCWPLVTFTMSPTATLWPGRSSATACQKEWWGERRVLRQRVRGNRRGEGGRQREETGCKLISDQLRDSQ